MIRLEHVKQFWRIDVDYSPVVGAVIAFRGFNISCTALFVPHDNECLISTTGIPQ